MIKGMAMRKTDLLRVATAWAASVSVDSVFRIIGFEQSLRLAQVRRRMPRAKRASGMKQTKPMKKTTTVSAIAKGAAVSTG